MHLLTTTGTTLEEIVAPVDLGQTPGDVVVMSFADSDLAGLAAAWEAEKHILPSVRFVQLRDLRHPLSVDLWIEKRRGSHAKVIVVRLLGGHRMVALRGRTTRRRGARASASALAVLPGEDRDDPRLADWLRPCRRRSSIGCCDFSARAAGRICAALLRRLARSCRGGAWTAASPRRCRASPPIWPDDRARSTSMRLMARLAAGPAGGAGHILSRAAARRRHGGRSMRCARRLSARGLAPAPLAITSLKDSAAAAFIRDALARLQPAVIVTTTAFAAGGEPGEPTPLDGPDVPVLQAIIATTRRSAWQESPRGLAAADLAMHVVLPELDGRVLAGAIAFKDPLPPHHELAFAALANRPEPDRIAMLADRVAALASLRVKPRAERRIAVLMPDYPGAPGRTGYAVGLDVPASVVALLGDLGGGRLRRARRAANAARAARCAGARRRAKRALVDLTAATMDLLARLPTRGRPRACIEAWGEPADDPDVRDGAFRFRASISAMSSWRCRRIAGAQRNGAPTTTIRHCRRATRWWPSACGCGSAQGRCGRAHGCPRHAGMAARQGGGADRGLLSGTRLRRAAGVLSVHRQQSRRGGAGQAPDRRA